MSDSGLVLVVAEADGASLPRGTLEAIGAGRAVCDLLGGSLECVLLGPSARAAGKAAIAAGCVRVHVSEAEGLTTNWAAAASAGVENLVRKRAAVGVILTGTENGQELGARLAMRLGVGCAAHCVGVLSQNGALAAQRRIYGGRFVETVMWDKGPFLMTVASAAFAPPAGQASGQAEVVDLDLPMTTKCSRLVARIPRAEERPDIGEAQIIVSVGRGIGGPEQIPIFAALADRLGAGLGASRAVVDAGWLEHAHQVGQTGRAVSPKVYIACAISGAVQHLVGISGARFILAINVDKEAPIFQVADVGIVGDALDVVPRLTKALT